MMRLFLVCFLLCSAVLGFAQNSIPPHPPSYVCYRTLDTIEIDGLMHEHSWQAAAWTDAFQDIQGPAKPKPHFQTKAKMLWNDSHLFIAVRLEEPHIWATLTERESIIYYDNDIEVFIDPNGDNHHYAELEFNAFGTIMDLLLARPYRNGVVPSFSWDCKKLKHAISIEGTINNPADIDTAWTIEMAIPLASIADLLLHYEKPVAGDQWRIGFSRVHWDTKIEQGKYVKLKQPEYNWTWSNQWAIDMHKPEFWGYLQFSDSQVGQAHEAFIPDVYWNEKMQLMAVYEALTKYRGTHGVFPNELEKLSLPEHVQKKKLSLLINAEQFIVKIKTQSGTVQVDHFGQILMR